MPSEQTTAAVIELLRRKENEYARKGWDNMGLHLYTLRSVTSQLGQMTPDCGLLRMPLPEQIERGGAGISRHIAALFSKFNGAWDHITANGAPMEAEHIPRSRQLEREWAGARLPEGDVRGAVSGFVFFTEAWNLAEDLREPGKLFADTVGAKEGRIAEAVLADGTIIQVVRQRGEKVYHQVDHVRDNQVGLAGAMWILACATHVNTVHIPQNFGWSRQREEQGNM